jgi:tRNA(Arg) A34 adenosine deaminase TadA
LKLKKLGIFFSIILILFLTIFSLRTQYYKITSEKRLINRYRQELDGLGQHALKSQDMPISAILIYNYEILGRGYNTVLRDHNVGGHAVINSISNAIEEVGLNTFMNLSRDSMKIITTYEPCEMCKGAMLEYKITSVEFLKSKSLSYWLDEHYRELGYEFSKRKLEGEELQDSLFRLHPAYQEVLPDY